MKTSPGARTRTATGPRTAWSCCGHDPPGRARRRASSTRRCRLRRTRRRPTQRSTAAPPAPSRPATPASPSHRLRRARRSSAGSTRAAGRAVPRPRATPGWPNGSHTFDVRAADTAGNPDASPATRTWTVAVPPPDTTAPDTTITGGPSGTATSGDASFTFTASEAGSTFECRLDAGSWAGAPLRRPTSGSPTARTIRRARHRRGQQHRHFTCLAHVERRGAGAARRPDGELHLVAAEPAGLAGDGHVHLDRNLPRHAVHVRVAARPARQRADRDRPEPRAGRISQLAPRRSCLRVTDSLGRFAEASNTITVSASTPPPPPPDADSDGVPDSSDQCPGTRRQAPPWTPPAAPRSHRPRPRPIPGCIQHRCASGTC